MKAFCYAASRLLSDIFPDIICCMPDCCKGPCGVGDQVQGYWRGERASHTVGSGSGGGMHGLLYHPPNVVTPACSHETYQQCKLAIRMSH